MAGDNTGFFGWGNVPPEDNSTAALIEQLTSQVASVTQANTQAEAAAASAQSAAQNASISEENVSNLAQQATTTLNSANAASAAANTALATAQAAVTTSTNEATIATTQATNAAASATTASNAATSAGASQTAAAGSATSAAASAATASTAQTNASGSAAAAATSASNASSYETQAASSASTATGAASTATTQASNASASANNASNSASAASGSASAAATSATNAAASATTAQGIASNINTLVTIPASSTALTVSPAQFTAGVFAVTGALTGNTTLTVPATAHPFMVLNQTTGSYSLTVNMTGGSVGSPVVQGYAANLVCDGVHGVYAASSNGGSANASLNPIVPAAGLTFIPYPHQAGFSYLMQRGVFLTPTTDYTDDATGFYLQNGLQTDGVETYLVYSLNTVTIANALTAASPQIVSGGITFADGSTQGVAAIGRNRLINGDFRVNNRGGGTPGLSSVTYNVDRWYTFQTGAAGQVTTASGGPNGTPFYLRVTGVASNTIVNAGQRIEAANIVDLAGKTVTISGYVIRTLGGTVGISYYIPTASDNYTTTNGRIPIGNVTCAPNVWTKFLFTFTLPAGATNGAQFEFGNAALLSGDFLGLADIQVEASSNPNPVYDRRHITHEVALCQRYYEKSPNYTFWPTNAPGAGQDCRQCTPFQVVKRTIPAMAYSGGALTNISTITFQGVNLNSFTFRIVSTAAGQFCADNVAVVADCEL